MNPLELEALRIERASLLQKLTIERKERRRRYQMRWGAEAAEWVQGVLIDMHNSVDSVCNVVENRQEL